MHRTRTGENKNDNSKRSCFAAEKVGYKSLIDIVFILHKPPFEAKPLTPREWELLRPWSTNNLKLDIYFEYGDVIDVGLRMIRESP